MGSDKCLAEPKGKGGPQILLTLLVSMQICLWDTGHARESWPSALGTLAFRLWLRDARRWAVGGVSSVIMKRIKDQGTIASSLSIPPQSSASQHIEQAPCLHCPTPCHARSLDEHSVWPLGPANPQHTLPYKTYKTMSLNPSHFWEECCVWLYLCIIGWVRGKRGGWEQPGPNGLSILESEHKHWIPFFLQRLEGAQRNSGLHSGVAAASLLRVIPSAEVVGQNCKCWRNALSSPWPHKRLRVPKLAECSFCDYWHDWTWYCFSNCLSEKGGNIG